MVPKNHFQAFVAHSAILLLLSACTLGSLPVDPNAVIAQYDGKAMQTPTNQNVVLVGGCFDILHFGHLEFLKKAKASGDYLIVALEPDESIINYKHRKPTHNQKERAEILAELRCVDLVILLPVLKGFVDYNQLVTNLHPNVIAVTADDPQLENKRKQADVVGANVKVVTPRLEGFSSSAIIAGRNPSNQHGIKNTTAPKKQETTFFQNIVQTGKKEARKFNVPTANIYIDANLNPGVYTCKVLVDEKWHNGMCYHDKKRPNLLEAHIFDYNEDLYGKKIAVQLCNFIRAPYNFKSAQEAEECIKNDVIACKRAFE